MSRERRHRLSSLRQITFCSLISSLYQGARGLLVMTLLRKGACLSRIEERTESYWSQSSDRSNEGELYSEEEEWISVHKLSESMLHSLRVMTVIFASGGFLIARLQWTAKWSEMTGSRTGKFETDVSPDLVIIGSRTLLFLCVGVQRLKISRWGLRDPGTDLRCCQMDH